MTTKHPSLKSILTAFYADHQANLHDGPGAAHPDIDAYVQKIEALFAPESTARITSITTPEGQRDYYRDLYVMARDENIRLTRDLAEYEAYDALPSLFEQVMTASERYVARFGGRLTEAGTAGKFEEEAGEFKEAITDLVIYYDEARQNLLEEFVDVMVTGGGVFAYYGIKTDELQQAMRDKLTKLDSRTEADYCWDEKSKTVIKRSKLESAS